MLEFLQIVSILKGIKYHVMVVGFNAVDDSNSIESDAALVSTGFMPSQGEKTSMSANFFSLILISCSTFPFQLTFCYTMSMRVRRRLNKLCSLCRRVSERT